MTRLTSLRGGTEPRITRVQPRITGVMRAARCGDGIRTVRWRRAVGGAERDRAASMNGQVVLPDRYRMPMSWPLAMASWRVETSSFR